MASSPNFFERARHSLPPIRGRTPSRSVIARQLGVTEKTIYQWERNKCVPSNRLLPAIAAVLNVSLADLGQAIAIQATQTAPKRGAA